MFLNTENKVLEDLQEDEQLEILKALVNGTLEYFNGALKEWHTANCLFSSTTYRAKPRELEIPWEVLNDNIKYVTYSPSQGVLGFQKYAWLEGEYWRAEGGGYSLDKVLKISTDGMDTSMAKRPEDKVLY